MSPTGKHVFSNVSQPIMIQYFTKFKNINFPWLKNILDKKNITFKIFIESKISFIKCLSTGPGSNNLPESKIVITIVQQ